MTEEKSEAGVTGVPGAGAAGAGAAGVAGVAGEGVTFEQEPTPKQIARWRRYLANERAEAAVYRELARRKTGEEREILQKIADSEARHEEYWRAKLGDQVGMPRQPDLNTRLLAFMARRFGSVFALALMQTAEARSPYLDDEDAPAQIAADEAVHSEVVRGLATRGREQMSGGFRAAVFGANDGLVSNLALVIGVMGSGVSTSYILLTGVAGLLAGALSMAAGEFVSVTSQRELLEASTPMPQQPSMLQALDLDANELALVYRARGFEPEEAHAMAEQQLANLPHHVIAADGAEEPGVDLGVGHDGRDPHEVVGSAWQAAGSSFAFFAGGALIPLIPFIAGAAPGVGAVIAVVLVSLALLITGGIVGVLSGRSPWVRALRQLAIGLGAAAITYGLGWLFGAVMG